MFGKSRDIVDASLVCNFTFLVALPETGLLSNQKREIRNSLHKVARQWTERGRELVFTHYFRPLPNAITSSTHDLT